MPIEDNAPKSAFQHPQFHLTGNLSSPEIYAEGIANMMIGFPVSRLVLHTFLEPLADGREHRRAVANLTMPTTALLELALNVLRACKSIEPQLMQIASSEAPAKLQEFLNMVPMELLADTEPAKQD